MTINDSPARTHALAYAEKLRTMFPHRLDRPATVIGYSVALDAHEPTRDYGYGHGVQTDNAQGDTPVLVIWRTDFGPVGSKRHDSLHRDLFLVDDGHTITPMYVGCWSTRDESDDSLSLYPFPVNFQPDGTPRMTGDGVRNANGNPSHPVDFGTWMLGPRRAWHLKVRETVTNDDA
jgi:hypothetical protein